MLRIRAVPFVSQAHRRRYHGHYSPAEAQGAEISQLLATYAAHPPQPITLSSLVAFGQPLTPESLLRSVSYVLSEIPRRLARRARALETLPFIVGTNPYVAKTLKAYRASFQFLATYPPVTTLEENAKFTAELNQLVESHRNDIPTMAKGYVIRQHLSCVTGAYFRMQIAVFKSAPNTCLQCKSAIFSMARYGIEYPFA